MGVGTPVDLLEAVHRGIDMFDCIIPSQLAQRGVAFTSQGKLQLRRTAYRLSEAALDTDCECPTCERYSRAYLHHLIKTDEVLGWHLLGQHNLSFYHRLMAQMRAAILNDEFLSFYRMKKAALILTDGAQPRQLPRNTRRRPTAALGDYEIYESPQGFRSLRQKSSGEVMHSVTAPSEEANKLYIEQSALAARLTEGALQQRELVIWDVGLGAAANAMAVVHRFESVGAENVLRSTRLISFERDLDSLALAIKHSAHFPHLWHRAPAAILADGHWRHASERLQWDLMRGDFSRTMDSAAPPDLIFYDPFSYKADAPLWTGELFAKVFKHCGGKSTELYTYSASTLARSALLAAGFFVARGVGTGPKSETTIAFALPSGAADHPLRPQLLAHEWLQRWRKSSAKFPASLSPDEQTRFAESIELHPQFHRG